MPIAEVGHNACYGIPEKWSPKSGPREKWSSEKWSPRKMVHGKMVPGKLVPGKLRNEKSWGGRRASWCVYVESSDVINL